MARRIRRLALSLLAGALAPILAGVCVGVAISLVYSAVYALDLGNPATRDAEAQEIVRRLQAAAPFIEAALLYGIALRLGRKVEGHPQSTALAALAGASVVGFSIGSAFGTPGGTMHLVYGLVNLLAVEAGVLLGHARARLAQALAGVEQALRSVTKESDVLRAITDAFAPLGLIAVSLEPGDGENRYLGSKTVRLLDLDRSPKQLRLEARDAWLFRLGHDALWSALAAHVAMGLSHLHALATVKRSASAEERQRVSDELHDSLAQDLISSVLHLDAAQERADDSGARAEHLREARRAAGRALEQARALVWKERGGPDSTSLVEALREAATDFERDSATRIVTNIVGPAKPLDERRTALLKRAVREGLTNARKHAAAKTVHVTLTYMEDIVALDIVDDGGDANDTEPKPAALGFGYGLSKLDERATALGARVSFEHEPGFGATLSLQVPTRDEGTP